MRLYIFKCILLLLLVSIAIASPNGRHKRDLSFFRNLFRSAIFGGEQYDNPTVLKAEAQYKRYRVPGYDDILVRVTPESSNIEALSPQVRPVNLNAFGSVVGTKNTNNTLVAMKNVNNLLTSGILNGNRNDVIQNSIPPMFPTLNIRETGVLDAIKTVPIIETREPVLTEVVKPFEAKLQLQVPFEPKYSYKQIQNNEPVLTYTAHNNPNVKVVETLEMKAELPTCIKKRIDEVILLGADPYNVQSLYPFQAPSVIDLSYPLVEASPYLQNSMLPQTLSERTGFSNKLPNGGFTNYYINRPNKIQAINPQPLPIPGRKRPKLDVVNINVPKENGRLNVGRVEDAPDIDNRLGISRTSRPTPLQYVPRNSSDVSKLMKTADQPKGTNVDSKDSILHRVIINNVNNQNKNNDLNSAALIKTGDTVKTNTSPNMKTSNFYYVPQVHMNSENSPKKVTKKDGVHFNKVIAEPASMVADPVSSYRTNSPEKSVLKTNEQSSFLHNPIVVPDITNYVYQQKHSNGSSISVKGGKNGVTIDVKESSAKRGDIPDEQ